MKQLIPINTGGGLKAAPLPSAHMNNAGALVLNLAADNLIGGEKWLIFYEEDASLPAAIEIRPAAATDKSAYKVTRSGGSAAKVTLRSLWQETNGERFVGRYSISKVAHGLRLCKSTSGFRKPLHGKVAMTARRDGMIAGKYASELK